MARHNGIPRALGRHALVGFAFSSALSVLGCDAIVDTKGRASCSTNSECSSRFGEPSACVESACVKLLSPECTAVGPADALTQDNAILIGYLGETTTGAKYGAPPRAGMKLALKEIETKYDGVPGVG